MTEEREVVVTGIGAVTPFGVGVDALWEALVSGRSAIRPISSFDAAPYPCRIAGEIADYESTLPAQEAARLDRGALFAIDAARQALADAGLPITPENAIQVGLAAGCARPGEATVWEGQQAFHEQGSDSMRAGYIARTLPNAPAAQTARALGVRGPALAVAAGGASGNVAIDVASSMIRSGDVQVAFAVGVDAPITPPALAAFCAMGVLTTRNDDPATACRPFDADANGFALSEGAAALLLEDEALAVDRGARVYGRLSGSANVTEPTGQPPSPQEAGRAMQSSLRRPGLLQQEIDYFCAYAPGMPQLDRMETDAIKRIFGELTASKLTISAPKSMLGHSLGASGVIDAIICLKAIEHGIIPPTINLQKPADGCDLDYTPGRALTQSVRHAMSYAYGFGGHHVALCFSAP